ncbi:MAG: T9SS type A sorting domain-containing protein [bacterium]
MKNEFKPKLPVVFVLALFVFSYLILEKLIAWSIAADSSNVTIEVTNQQTGSPLDSVLVRLQGINNAETFEGYTDTSGRIIFQNIPTDVKAENILLPQSFGISVPYPQPTKDLISVDFALPENQQVTITLYNVLGQKICRVRQTLGSGNYQVILNLGILAAGMYIVKI